MPTTRAAHTLIPTDLLWQVSRAWTLEQLRGEWERLPACRVLPWADFFLSKQLLHVFAAGHQPGLLVVLWVHMCALATADMLNQRSAFTTRLAVALVEVCGKSLITLPPPAPP